MTPAQLLLTIVAELLIFSGSALYGYLFIAGLFHRSPKPVQTAIPTQVPLDSIASTTITDTPLAPVTDTVQPEGIVPAGAIVLLTPLVTAIMLAKHFQTVSACPCLPLLCQRSANARKTD